MDLLQIIILAVIQGTTEFLPISSSAHLVLVPKLTGWQDQGLVFDLALHLGSLIAVISYFFTDLKTIVSSGLNSIFIRKLDRNSKLFFAVGFATVPVGIAGLLWQDIISTNLRSIVIIAWASIIFGIVLWLADCHTQRRRQPQDEYSLKWQQVMLIGCTQALALIPGASRAGVTMTAGLFLGLSRQAAARFSFLMAVPVIILAGSLKLIELINGQTIVDTQLLIIAVVISAIVAYLVIHFFLNLLDRVGMLPFVIYRVLLGIGLLVFFYAP